MVGRAQDARVVVHHGHRVAVGQKVAHDLHQAVDVQRGAGRWTARPARRARRWCGCARRGPAARAAARRWRASSPRGRARGTPAPGPRGGAPCAGTTRRCFAPSGASRGRARPGTASTQPVRPSSVFSVACGQVDARHLRLQCVGRQARAVAHGAGALLEEPRHARQALLVLHLRQRVLHGVDGVVVGEIKLGEGVGFLRLVQDVLLLGGAVEHDVALLGRELVERHVGAHAHLARNLLHEVPHERAPRCHRALVDGERLVGHKGAFVHGAHDAGAVAFRTGAVAVEGQRLGARAEELHAADGARDGALGSDVQRGRHAVAVGAHMAAHAREQESEAVQELGGGAERAAHSGHGGPLVQREGGGHVQHLVHVGAPCLREAAARVGGERLEVAPRALRVQHAEGERRLSRARHARDGHELVQRDVHVEVLQVVHARPAHLDAVRGGRGVRKELSGRVRGMLGRVVHSVFVCPPCSIGGVRVDAALFAGYLIMPSSAGTFPSSHMARWRPFASGSLRIC